MSARYPGTNSDATIFMVQLWHLHSSVGKSASVLKSEIFSRCGDSGSSVFDTLGNVVRLVMSSTSDNSYDWRGIPEKVPSNSRKLTKHPGSNAWPEEAEETTGADLPTWLDGRGIIFAAPMQWMSEDTRDFTRLQPRLA
jgi:hypothetical protein